MSHSSQWWHLHLNIIVTLLVHEFLEGRNGVLIIFLPPGGMVSRWCSINIFESINVLSWLGSTAPSYVAKASGHAKLWELLWAVTIRLQEFRGGDHQGWVGRHGCLGEVDLLVDTERAWDLHQLFSPNPISSSPPMGLWSRIRPPTHTSKREYNGRVQSEVTDQAMWWSPRTRGIFKPTWRNHSPTLARLNTRVRVKVLLVIKGPSPQPLCFREAV